MRKPKFPDTLPEGVVFPAVKPPRRARGAAGLAEMLDHEDPDAPPDIAFTPVPRLRSRRSGWTEQRQRAFIAALARCASVSAAARHVGLSVRSAYRLLASDGAEDFARAWDEATDQGLERMRWDGIERSIDGAWVPVYRRGKLQKVEHRRNDRLAIAVLSGQPKEVDTYRRLALTRHQHQRDLAELDAARAERDRQIEEAHKAFSGEVNRLVDRIHDQPRGPRILPL